MLACWSCCQQLQQLQECVWKLPMAVLHSHSPPHPADSLSHSSRNSHGYSCLCTQKLICWCLLESVFAHVRVEFSGAFAQKVCKLDKNLTLNVTVSSLCVWLAVASQSPLSLWILSSAVGAAVSGL